MAADSEPSTGAMPAKQIEQVDTWSAPNVQPDEDTSVNKTNALGQPMNWRYEPPEETEVNDPVPLTAQDIEDIRQAAFEEGFSEGRADGFAKGFDEGKTSGHDAGLISGS
ncbi:MAG: flagellar assembly protein FliH, partial [Cognaticolwellia sp.]